MDNINRLYNCKICKKNYKSYKSLWNHNKSFHIKSILCEVQQIQEIYDKSSKILSCDYCNKIFNCKSSKSMHKKVCKTKNNIILNNNYDLENKKLELEKINAENLKLKEEKAVLKLKNALQNSNRLDKNIEKFDEMKSIVGDLKLQIKKMEENNEIELNNRFLNIITEKNNVIEELNNKLHININKELVTINQEITQIKSLTFNGVVIVSRSDGFVDATQLCKAGGKQFKHWYSLESTKQLVLVLKSKVGIPTLDLIEINKGGNHIGSWIHPDLAIQLAQWISPLFALQVSEWIRTLFADGNVSINIKLQNEVKLKDSKIKLLEDTYLKKHKLKYYLENVIYIVSTEENIKKRIYIIGKASSLKNRLSTYNKTGEHIVIYNKSCKNKDDLTLIESIILNKLTKYREKANRDRFILPLEKDIVLFTDIIDDVINYL
jgi:hypothetical protein